MHILHSLIIFISSSINLPLFSLVHAFLSVCIYTSNCCHNRPFVCWSFCRFGRMFTRSSNIPWLSLRPSVGPSAHPSIIRTTIVHLVIRAFMYVFPAVCLSVRPPIRLFIRSFTYRKSVWTFVRFYVFLIIRLPIHFYVLSFIRLS